nr:hypothetical protein [Tanacetum cinerariifolium]
MYALRKEMQEIHTNINNDLKVLTAVVEDIARATYPTFLILRHLMKDMYLLVKEEQDHREMDNQNGDFKLLDDANIFLRTPRQHNMYSIDLNNIVPHRDLTWHNLVRGLPTKCFENDHTCTAYLKGKQHKASCKSKIVNSVTKPLHTLHMDLFGPTSDETGGILKKFITEIENLKDLNVKIIRCDNEGEFRNKEMNDFCSQKGVKREFSNARTPQQNGVAERRNRTLIKAARTMLADAKLPVTFWAEAVNTACYV